MLNDPSAEVIVPVEVPFSTMFTPGNADPSSEDVTFPVTVLPWDHATDDSIIKKRRTVKYLLNR
jgi:hypothetical protein